MQEGTSDDQVSAPDDQVSAPDDQVSAPDDQVSAPDDQVSDLQMKTTTSLESVTTQPLSHNQMSQSVPNRLT